MVKILSTVRRGSILFKTVSEFVALMMILAPRNNQTKITGAAIIRRTIS
tara:strand:+ start:160 stop:306 length:147 start_codon:yes stop_codon:yes gene_type:complete